MPTTPTTPPFTREALERVFERANFKAFQQPGFMSHYWAPLISACSGSRRNEIFFLSPDDVGEKDGIGILHIKAGAASRTGSGLPSRDIPIHPTLKRLGLLDFVEARRRSHPQERLFSEYKAIQEQAGVLFSRAFVGWIKTTVSRLPEEQRQLFAADFHFPSLRALFLAEAIRTGMSEAAMRQILGTGTPVRPARTETQGQAALAHADAEIRRLDIESYFPPLCPYQELMA